jgi:hypothetical protein
MRFWSPQQKYLLKVLNVTSCMRKSQVLPLLCRQFDISPNAIAPICRQLRDAGYLREFDGIISAVGPHYEPFIPQALDLIFAILPRETILFHRESCTALYALGEQSGLLVRVFYISQKQDLFALPGKKEAMAQEAVLTVLLLNDAAQAAYIPPHFSCLVAYTDHTGKLTLQQHGGGKQHET